MRVALTFWQIFALITQGNFYLEQTGCVKERQNVFIRIIRIIRVWLLNGEIK